VGADGAHDGPPALAPAFRSAVLRPCRKRARARSATAVVADMGEVGDAVGVAGSFHWGMCEREPRRGSVGVGDGPLLEPASPPSCQVPHRRQDVY
jgi:hypothetical protein